MKKILFEKSIFLVYLSSFFLSISLLMVLPVLPIYLHYYDYPVQYIGIVATSVAISALIFRPIAAKMIMRFGAFQVALMGSVAYLIPYILFIAYPGAGIVLTARILQGVGVSLFATATGTAISQILPSKDLMNGISYLTIANSVAGSIAPYLGLLLISNMNFKLMYYVGLFFTVIGFIIIVILYLKYGHQTKPIRNKDRTIKRNSLREVYVALKKSFVPVTVTFFLVITTSGISNYLTFYGLQKGISNVGSFFLFNLIGLFIGKVVLNPALKKLGYSKSYWIIAILYPFMFIGFTLTSSLLIWNLFGIVQGFLFNMVLITLNTLSVRFISYEMKSAANALFLAGIDLGFFTGGIIWGFLTTNQDYSVIFWGSALTIFVIFALTATYFSHQPDLDNSK